MYFLFFFLAPRVTAICIPTVLCTTSQPDAEAARAELSRLLRETQGAERVAAVAALLQRCPAAVRVAGRNEQLPLHEALRRPNASLELVSLLLERYPEALQERDADGNRPLHLAAAWQSARLWWTWY